MFLGITESGITREVQTSSDYAQLARKRDHQCLGIVNTAVLSLAAFYGNQTMVREAGKTMGMGISPCASVTCRGILPRLRLLVSEECKESKTTHQLQALPDTHQGEGHATNPYEWYVTHLYC